MALSQGMPSGTNFWRRLSRMHSEFEVPTPIEALAGIAFATSAHIEAHNIP